MEFKIDENLPVEAAELLREAGYDAVTVLEQRLGGGSDVDVAAVCRRERRALVTLDMDFSDIRSYPPKDFYGLVVFHLRYLDKSHVLDALRHVMSTFAKEPLEHHIWIVEEGRIRIRD
jgi:predicted nuclease of predicted toxin-antitoxin system